MIRDCNTRQGAAYHESVTSGEVRRGSISHPMVEDPFHHEEFEYIVHNA